MSSSKTIAAGIHLGQRPDLVVLERLADFICGDDSDAYPTYRTGTQLTAFFKGVGIDAEHDGNTRRKWVIFILEQLDARQVENIILQLVSIRLYAGDKRRLALASRSMNDILLMDGLGVDFADGKPVLVRQKPIDLGDLEDYAAGPDPVSADEADFLQQSYDDDIQIAELNLNNAELSAIIQDRIDEVRKAPPGGMPLGCLFLLGSSLEGLLLAVATEDQAAFMSAKAAPKDKAGTTRQLGDWTLNSLIDAAFELGLLKLDVKNFSHELRDFRNFIHPYSQWAKSFSPTQETIDISWQVFKAAFVQLKKSRE